jgi:ketosteroid isomerase-like protein
MTSQNERRVHEALDAMARGDIDAIVALAEPDVEFVNPDTALEPGTRHGPDGLRTGLGGVLEAFEDLRFEPERVVDLGDRVLATGSFSGRGRGSGYQFDPQPFCFLVTLRGENMIRFEWFADTEDAFRAAGIDPD